MDTSHLQLTPELREALRAHPGEPLHIADEETRKVYLLVEQGAFPELEEEYIRQGLAVARDQISKGDTSTAAIADIISRAKRQSPLKR
jgi:hypothetical protein